MLVCLEQRTLISQAVAAVGPGVVFEPSDTTFVMELWVGMDKHGFNLVGAYPLSEFYPIHTEMWLLRWVLKERNVTVLLSLPKFSDILVYDTEGREFQQLPDELSTQCSQPGVQVWDFMKSHVLMDQ